MAMENTFFEEMVDLGRRWGQGDDVGWEKNIPWEEGGLGEKMEPRGGCELGRKRSWGRRWVPRDGH